MIKQLAHVCLTAKDLAATEDFYCGALGLEKLFNFCRDGKTIGFYLKVTKDTFIEVFALDASGSASAVAPEGPIGHLCFEVDDIDEVVARLKALGYEAGQKSFGPDNSWQAWTADPSGVRIEFHQYTPESTQLTGNDCILE